MSEDDKTCLTCGVGGILFMNKDSRHVLVCHGPMLHDEVAIACLDDSTGYPGWRPKQKR